MQQWGESLWTDSFWNFQYEVYIKSWKFIPWMIQTQSRSRKCNVAKNGGSTSVCTSTVTEFQSCNTQSCCEFHDHQKNTIIELETQIILWYQGRHPCKKETSPHKIEQTSQMATFGHCGHIWSMLGNCCSNNFLVEMYSVFSINTWPQAQPPCHYKNC